MKKTIGILAHVDAGKTTFSEQILYHTNSIRVRGRVDHKTSFLDNHFIERERGITVFSDQGLFDYGKSTYYLIDTPGHVDFSCEMERAIAVMDYAIIVLSGVEGVQGHTETVWELLKKHNIPTIFFINKLDRTNADKHRVIDEIKSNLTKNCIYIDKNLSKEELSNELIELISEYDEQLLEMYLEDDYNKELWIKTFVNLMKGNEIYPIFGGSALQDEGIVQFLENVETLTYTDYNENDSFSGRVYKIRHEENGNKITFIKALTVSMNVRDEITYGDNIKEKVSSIRLYNGSKFKNVDKVAAGDIVGVTGLSEANAGDGLGTLTEKIHYDLVPTMMSKVIFDKSSNVKEVLSYFKMLDREDPALNVVWSEALQEIHVHIMGTIQLEVLREILQERFNLKIEFGPCKILYKETIAKETKGAGHFEPLRHYA